MGAPCEPGAGPEPRPAVHARVVTGRGWESKLAAKLGRVDRDDIAFLHDRRIPGARGNIDHVVICPSGLYVIDAKRYKGAVSVRNVGGFFSGPDLRLIVGRRGCTKLARNIA